MRPEDVVERDGRWYHATTGEDVSDRAVWWLCSLGHEWEATVADRVAGLADCPECAIAELVQP